MDIIVQRNFDQEEVQNYAGAESSEDVAAGIISFDDSHFGRQISELCLRYVSRYIYLQVFALRVHARR